MSDDLQTLSDRLSGLIAKLAPAEQRKLARRLVLDLRMSNRLRIQSNLEPSGRAMVARKKPRPLRQKRLSERTRLRARLMFPKIAQANSLKFKVAGPNASLFFSGRRGRAALSTVAMRHQFGLGGLPRRRLLGFSPQDLRLIETTIVDFLAK